MKSEKPVKTAETQPAFMSVKETTRIIGRSKKSKEEVNKMFIDSATVILRDKVGGHDAKGDKRTPTKKG